MCYRVMGPCDSCVMLCYVLWHHVACGARVVLCVMCYDHRALGPERCVCDIRWMDNSCVMCYSGARFCVIAVLCVMP